ncbi:MAG: conjugal transfer protein [Alphaproteobacteria bacterium]|nr:MAG: conjugal transfer protein [Alphaproteobacteria bacterium]
MTPARIRRLSLWVAVPVTLLAGIALAAQRVPALALINESPSLPLGVYTRTVKSEPARGDVVALSQPPSTRPYLRGLGMPSDVKLLKRVAAVGGDRVCETAGKVATPLREVPVMARDRRGVAVPAWRECRVLRADELFVLGDTPGSFDSRYFGPIHRAQVDGVYRETLTW